MLHDTDENFSLEIGQMAALAFLPTSEIEDAWLQIKDTVADGDISVINYSNENYVRGEFLIFTRLRNPISSLSTVFMVSTRQNKIWYSMDSK